MMEEYQHCSMITESQLECAVDLKSACKWTKTFLQSCARRILGRCLQSEALEIILRRQKEEFIRRLNCSDVEDDDHKVVILTKHHKRQQEETELISRLLRLG